MPTDDLAFHSRIDKYDGEGSSEETLPKTQQGDKFIAIQKHLRKYLPTWLTMVSLIHTGENFVHDAKSAVSNMPDFIDIDTDHMDPRLCSLYAHDIFLNLRDSEVCSAIHFNIQESLICSYHFLSRILLKMETWVRSATFFKTVNAGNLTDARVFSFCILLPDYWKTNFYIHGKSSARYKAEYAGNFSWLACWGIQFFVLDTRKKMICFKVR